MIVASICSIHSMRLLNFLLRVLKGRVLAIRASLLTARHRLQRSRHILQIPHFLHTDWQRGDDARFDVLADAVDDRVRHSRLCFARDGERVIALGMRN